MAGLIAGLHYLKHSYVLSGEQVVLHWAENLYWQYFCGAIYFQHELPIDPTSMTRWRKRLGPDGMESLLQVTIDAALQARAVKRSDLKRVTVDTTVQEKALIGHMKNNGLLHRNWLKGCEGDAVNVFLCGSGQNLRLILNYLRVLLAQIRSVLAPESCRKLHWLA